MGKHLELTPRLRQIAAWVRQGAHLADVGTDHAYLPVWLTLQGRVASAIASDLRRGPLDRAQETGRRYGVGDRITFRLGNGLAAVAPEECDTIVIAGMGGETMAGVLSRALWTREGKTLILQPQSTQDVLRRFLAGYGWRIRSERVVREGERWYPILVVEGGEMPPLTPGEAMAGKPETWVEQPERRGYLEWLLGRTRAQLAGLARSAKPEDQARRDALTRAEAFLEAHLS